MKTRRFDFNWRPLQLQISIFVDGSVPDSQNYNADSQEYTPDYTITPVIIQPVISILDKDEVIHAGRINHALTNIRWYENINGTRTLINTDNAYYEITSSGGNAGRLKVKKNAQPKVPITLEFYAEYVGSRNSQVHTIRGTYQLSCSSASGTVRVELNAAPQTIYNPFSDPDTQAVTAKVWLDDKPCAASKYALVWQILGEDGSWHDVGTDETLDYAVTISGDTATVNRRLMGTELYLRCYAKYSATGSPAGVSITAATPQALVAFVRRLPKFEYDFTGVPVNIPAGLLVVAPTAIIRTTNGEISSADREVLPLWYIATNKASGSLSYSLVAHGMEPTIPTRALDQNYGAVIGLDVVDRGAAGAFMDAADGKVFTDADGKVIVIQ